MKAVLSDRLYMQVTPELEHKINNELTYRFPAPNNPRATVEYNDVIHYKNNLISIPVARTDLIPEGYEVVDKRTLAPTTFGEFRYTLRAHQQEAVDEIDDSYILNAHTGSGKSVMGTFLAKKFGQKTLVIVHTTILRDQWVTEVENITGWKPGIIGGGKFNIDTPIVIANIQTLRNKIDKVRDVFGTVILDEVQYVAATTFKKVMDKMKARYKFGMSATLKRKDKKGVLIHDYISTQVYVVPEVDKVTPSVVMEHIPIKLDSNPMVPWTEKINKLYKTPDYLYKVVALVETLQLTKRKILVVADRVDFIKECAELTNDCILIHGAVEDRDTKMDDINRGKSVIYGITSMFKEGVNLPILDTLVITSQINNDPMLEQLVGRLTRPHPDNQELLVWDFWLRGPQANNQAKSRRRFYREHGFEVIEVDNGI